MTKTTFYRHHKDPIVELLLNTEPSPDKLAPAIISCPYISHPKLQAMVLISLAESGLRSYQDAIQLVQKVFHEPCHVDLQLLFLCACYIMHLNMDPDPYGQLKALETEINALVSVNTPAEIRATVCFVKAVNLGMQRNYRKRFELAEQLIEGIPPESPYYNKMMAMRIMTFYGYGMGATYAADEDKIVLSDFDTRMLMVARLLGFAHTGDLENAALISEQVAALQHHKFMKSPQQMYNVACAQLSLIAITRSFSFPHSISVQEDILNSPWYKSTQALIVGNPKEALYWARKYAEQDSPTKLGESYPFLDTTLVRAELAVGNGRAAKRLLLSLDQAGTINYVDDFYWARAERLLGNFDVAAFHMRQLRDSIVKYNARGKYDFEVSLATELTPAGLLELSSSAKKSSIKNRESLPPNKTGLGFSAIISESSQMQIAKNAIKQFAPLDQPVIITGETGTGKELVAQALHQQSPRSHHPFIAINCGAISDALIESEMFGHARGAFTGAHTTYKGLFREAGKGTVYLDEIADISAHLQTALLRVLETNEVRPVGSTNHYKIHCRIIASSNRPLSLLVEEKSFRSDLYYRLQRLEINIPPLRDRISDIGILAYHFLNRNREEGEHATLSHQLIHCLEQYKWPGNVRELRNVIDQLRILSSDKLNYDVQDIVTHGLLQIPDNQQISLLQNSQTHFPAHFAPATQTSYTNIHELLADGSNPFRRKQRLRQIFQEVNQLNVSEAARLLGVTRKTARRYILELCNEGTIEKITQNSSAKSQYYTIR